MFKVNIGEKDVTTWFLAYVTIIFFPNFIKGLHYLVGDMINLFNWVFK